MRLTARRAKNCGRVVTRLRHLIIGAGSRWRTDASISEHTTARFIALGLGNSMKELRPGGPLEGGPRRQPWVRVVPTFSHGVATDSPEESFATPWLCLLQLQATPSRAWLHSDGPPGLKGV